MYRSCTKENLDSVVISMGKIGRTQETPFNCLKVYWLLQLVGSHWEKEREYRH